MDSMPPTIDSDNLATEAIIARLKRVDAALGRVETKLADLRAHLYAQAAR